MSSAAAPGLDPAALQRKARFGVFVLVLRTVGLQLTVLVGEVYLRRLLSPADFGAFAIAQFMLVFFAQFGDAGLGGALIQKDTEPSQTELSSIWCLQMLLGSLVVAAMWVAAPLAVDIWPDLPSGGIWLFRALSLDLLLTSARVVPTVLLERHLNYGRLATLEVLLTIPYYAAAITLARMHYGVMALAGAILAQGVAGVVGAFVMRPWMPSLVLDVKALRPIVRFGIAYQTKHFIGLVTGAIAPLYAGRALGQTQLGFIDWAQRTAYFPLQLVSVMSRVSFPLYSRLQGDSRMFAQTLERSVQVCAIATLFFVGLAFGLGPNIVHVVYTDKWLPALPLFYVYAAGIAVGFLSPLVFPAFDATGRPGINVRFTIGWTVGTVVLAPLLAARWGSLGFAIGYCIPMVLGNLGIIVVLKRLIPDARLWPRIRASILGAIAIAMTGRYVLAPWGQHALQFIAMVLVEVVLFVGVVLLLDRNAIREVRSWISK